MTDVLPYPVPEVERAVTLLRPTRSYRQGVFGLPSPDDPPGTCYVLNDVDKSLAADHQVHAHHTAGTRNLVVQAPLANLTDRPKDIDEPNVLVFDESGQNAVAIWRMREPLYNEKVAQHIAIRLGGKLVPEHHYVPLGPKVVVNHDGYFAPVVPPEQSPGPLKVLDTPLAEIAARYPKVRSEAWEAVGTDGDYRERAPLGDGHKDRSRSGTEYWLLLHLAGAGLTDDELFTIWSKEAIGAYLREQGRGFVSRFARELARVRNKVAVNRLLEKALVRVEKPADDGSREIVPLPDPIPARPIIVRGLLQRKIVTLIAGKGGDGKSLFTLQASVAFAVGRAWGGYEPVGPLKVLYINNEDDREEVQRRLAAVCRELGVDPAELAGRFHHYSGDNLVLAKKEPGPGPEMLAKTDGFESLAGWCRQESYDVIVLDPLVEFFDGLDENDNQHMAFFMRTIRELARETSAAILMVHHFRKSGVGGESDSMRGGSAIVNSCRLALTFERDDKTVPAKAGKVIRVTGAKANYQPLAKPAFFEFVTHEVNDLDTVAALRPVDVPEAEAFEQWDDLVALVARGNAEGLPFSLATKGPSGRRLDKAVAERFEMPEETARKVISRAAGLGKIIEATATVNKEKVTVWAVGGEVPF